MGLVAGTTSIEWSRGALKLMEEGGSSLTEVVDQLVKNLTIEIENDRQHV